MFRDLSLKTNYSSEYDDLYGDFFLPVLENATAYRRAVAYFSPGVLLNAPAAMSRIVDNNGRIELIFGKLVSKNDFDAIREGASMPRDKEDSPPFNELIREHPDSLLAYRIKVLAWLFANDHLEMKVAFRKNGLFHQKTGLFTDQTGDMISFDGSMNETNSALDPECNSEAITVFRSWEPGQRSYIDNHESGFARLWSGRTRTSTMIVDLPKAIEENLLEVADQFPARPDPEEETELVRALRAPRVPARETEARESKDIDGETNVPPADEARRHSSAPTIPRKLGDLPFTMRPHQMKALRAWADNGHNGIMELATGAGKTITAIYAVVKTAEANDGMTLIVSVPYQDLADQWCDQLKIFNIRAVRCYGARADWERVLNAHRNRGHGGHKEFLAIVVVNKTLKTDRFQDFVRGLDSKRVFFIGDECHHHGAVGFVDKLFPEVGFRIGLSATPFDYIDEAKNTRLRAVYDRSVFGYDLGQAVKDGVLTEYEYFPIPVELTKDESEKYMDLSKRISRAFAQHGDNPSDLDDGPLSALLGKRARLVGAAANKMVALEQLLDEKRVESHSLFYCGDGETRIERDESESNMDDSRDAREQRIIVADILMRRNVNASPFTSHETPRERRDILNSFKNADIDAMIAIKCLDEGIDVPACTTAYLMASSRNPRQFVQRRGRILRKAKGKEVAYIYDFVVVMPGCSEDGKMESDFLRQELRRVADFARHSKYPNLSVEPLEPWLERYNLKHVV